MWLTSCSSKGCIREQYFQYTQFCKRNIFEFLVLKLLFLEMVYLRNAIFLLFLGFSVALKVVSNMILAIEVTLSAVVVALPLSGSTLWNEAFSAYDFTLDVVFLFQKWFVYEVMLSISSTWNDSIYITENHTTMSSICLLCLTSSLDHLLKEYHIWCWLEWVS